MLSQAVELTANLENLFDDLNGRVDKLENANVEELFFQDSISGL